MKKVQIALGVVTTLLICFIVAFSVLLSGKLNEKKCFHVSKKQNKITKNLLSKYPVTEKKSFVVVIASYNNEAVCEKNLFSIFDQTYDHYRVIYIDDCSTDKTYEKVKNFVHQRGQEKKVTLIQNETRKLKLANLYQAFSSCADDEIIVCVDGDDWLAHENVLKELNHYYQNPDIWLTYGSAINHPKYSKRDGACLPDKALTKNTVRDIPFNISMLRSFYAGLFKKIKLKDLLYQGRFLPSADDFAFMIPIIEMAPTHALYVPEVLYVINDTNPIRESNTIESLQVKLMRYLKTKEKYKPLDVTFNPRELDTPHTNTPVDLIILSNDDPLSLSKALKNYPAMIESLDTLYVLYRASDQLMQKAYEELSNYHPSVTFALESELSLKQVIEHSKNRAPYIAIGSDTAIIKEPIDIPMCIKELEMTSSVNFFLANHSEKLKGLKLKDKVSALTIDSALKAAELFSDSYFVIVQKKFLLDNLPIKEPSESLLKALFLKEKNLQETTLFLTHSF